MTPLEANASGRPVIAFDGGGARETVLPGVTGVTFPEQTPESLLEAVEELRRSRFDRETLVRHAWRFDKRQFQDRIREVVTKDIDAMRADQVLEADGRANQVAA